jgi:hypothetical protein
VLPESCRRFTYQIQKSKPITTPSAGSRVHAPILHSLAPLQRFHPAGRDGPKSASDNASLRLHLLPIGTMPDFNLTITEYLAPRNSGRHRYGWQQAACSDRNLAGRNPVCLAIRANMRGPISSSS